MAYLPLPSLSRQDSPVKLRRLVSRHAQRSPFAGRVVFGQENDLSAVVGVVRDLAVDGLHHRMRLAANGDGGSDVSVGKRRERIEYFLPAVIPDSHQIGASGGRIRKFGVPTSGGGLSPAGAG